MTTTDLGPSWAEAGSSRTRAAHRTTRRTPAWVPIGVALVCLLAAYLYGWGLGGTSVHPYYTAAVRSMATSWHAFWYGGLDSSGSITVDKLPGYLWPQALSVRIFGMHVWAVALPQAIEGVATVLVLYRVVSRWAGAVAGLLAALMLAVTPIATALDRGDIADTLLTLLLVLAAGSAMNAVRTGGLRPLLACALWTGLAFQAKMVQAWVVIPVFGLVVLYAAPTDFWRRVRNLVVAGVTALLVSCSWLLWVWITPASQRPYLDGTTGNNPFALAFGYNGLSRFGSSATSSNPGFGSVAGTAASRPVGGSGWTVLLNHTAAPQISWFLPVALLGLGLGLAWRRSEPRTDQGRAGFLLWGGWLAINTLAFGASSGIHDYYLVVLAPALAALAAAGLTTSWAAYRAGGDRSRALLAALLVGVLWAVVVSSKYKSFDVWLVPVVGLLALLAAAGLARGGTKPRPRIDGITVASAVTGLLALVLAPAAWCVSTATNPLYAGVSTSPLAGPVGSGYTSMLHHGRGNPINFAAPAGTYGKLLTYLEQNRGSTYYLVATQSAEPAEPLLRATSEPILVTGGFTGNTPFPSAQQMASLVQQGQLRFVITTSIRPKTAASEWVTAHCAVVSPAAYGMAYQAVETLYDCRSQL
ncbi:ArnT family glycosyltransferase [Streptacidiphilus fuscans]|uniref:Glycosyltransferase family 39 protein n=1 Tax=Streptacidiphilus fuscans TaxID=2789292 RepID=A0A931B9F3_9ACTN|nr:glycosyltransferase family 39 protein [Streptacidiphilus fuscans]MBF9071962.1 glycosyltransferase family 39 protein [Streptacidiphilus fuscans]